MQTADDWIYRAYGLLTTPFFSIGDASFSVLSLVKLFVFAGLIVWASRIVRGVLTRRVFPRFHVEPGPAHALSNLVAYVIFVVGLLVGLQTAGIELSTLTVIFGALGLGIGFGLQPIVLNFVSGLVLLLERPIQVGDRIQLGELHGRVTRIQARATEVLSNDNIAVIVPNSEFISQRVVNWSQQRDLHIRSSVPVGAEGP